MTLALPRTASEIRLRPSSSRPFGIDRLGECLDLGEEVVAHPRDGGELDPVGLLVEADPEPEVGGVGAELALDVDDVRRHQQQPAGRLVERIELAEDLGGEEAEQQPDLAAGDLGPDRQRHPAGGALLLLQLVEDRPEHDRERLGVGLHPALPVDHEHRRGALGSGQSGELADESGRALGVRAQLGHRVGGLGRRHDRSRSGDPAPEGDRDVPVDHRVHVPTLAGHDEKPVSVSNGRRRVRRRGCRCPAAHPGCCVPSPGRPRARTPAGSPTGRSRRRRAH